MTIIQEPPGLADRSANAAANSTFIPLSHLKMSHKPRTRSVTHGASGIAATTLAGFVGDGMVSTTTAGNPYDVLILSLDLPHRTECEIPSVDLYYRGPARNIIWVPEATAYSARYPASTQSLSLLMPAGRMQSALEPDAKDSIEPALIDSDERIAALMRIIGAEISNPGFSSDLLIDGATRAIAALLARGANGKVDELGRPLNERIWLSPIKLRRITDYIEAHIAETITLTELADIAGLSSFHFVRVFKHATGESPYHYVTSRRLALARRLLAIDALSIEEISKSCGFAGQSHFTRAFSQKLAISPGRYRREILN